MMSKIIQNSANVFIMTLLKSKNFEKMFSWVVATRSRPRRSKVSSLSDLKASVGSSFRYQLYRKAAVWNVNIKITTTRAKIFFASLCQPCRFKIFSIFRSSSSQVSFPIHFISIPDHIVTSPYFISLSSKVILPRRNFFLRCRCQKYWQRRNLYVRFLSAGVCTRFKLVATTLHKTMKFVAALHNRSKFITRLAYLETTWRYEKIVFWVWSVNRVNFKCNEITNVKC
jgi:hypothetical protein